MPRENKITARTKLIVKKEWDANMKIKKILMIALVISILSIASFSPISITVLAGTTDTITITFDPQGNISLDVFPEEWNLSIVWSYSNESTTNNYFTLWNNGSVDMQTDIQITTSPADLYLDYNNTPTADNYYGLNLTGATISGRNHWVQETAAIQLDSNIVASASVTFGFTFYLSNITANHTWQTLVVTLTGSQTS